MFSQAPVHSLHCGFAVLVSFVLLFFEGNEKRPSLLRKSSLRPCIMYVSVAAHEAAAAQFIEGTPSRRRARIDRMARTDSYPMLPWQCELKKTKNKKKLLCVNSGTMCIPPGQLHASNAGYFRRSHAMQLGASS